MASDTSSEGEVRPTPTSEEAVVKADELVNIREEDIGMVSEIKQLYSGPEDKKGRFQWQATPPKDLHKPAEDAASLKFAYLARYVKTYGDGRRNLALHSIVIQSPLLRELLGEVLKGYPGVSTELTRVEFSGQFEPLIHRWEQLTSAIEKLKLKSKTPDDAVRQVNGLSLTNGDRKTVGSTNDSVESHQADEAATSEAVSKDQMRLNHALLLHELLATEFKDIIESSSDMIKKGQVTFELLWTVFQPGSLIYAKVMQRDRGFRLHSARYGRDRNGAPVYYLTLKYIDFDGTRHGTNKVNLPITTFEGTRPLTTLAGFPLESHTQHEVLKERLQARGAKVEALAGTHYRAYDGMGHFINYNGELEHISVRGRVMIDTISWNKWQPNQAVYLTALHVKDTAVVNGFNGATSGDGDDGDDGDRYGGDDDDDNGGDLFLDDDICAPVVNDEESKQRPSLTPEQLMLCSPIVRGYALKEKTWVNMFVNDVRDVAFNVKAFESLVLPDNQKDLLLGFTAMQQSAYTQWDDVVSGKGKGIIMLLSGPPGVGKTLTAESVAEEMRVPLYSVTAGDLGSDRNLEKKLVDIFAMVTRWNAILLLDEADVFLEVRSLEAIERNKLVSIFLRVLEYFEGIAFLTTNRVNTFDPAFQSRIHISIDYPELSAESRKTVWKNFLASHNVVQVSARDKTPKFDLPAPADDTTQKAKADYTKAKTEHEKALALHPKRTLPHEITDKDVDALSKKSLNGRQIKNLLKTAQLLAIYRGEALSKKHIDHSLSVTQHLLQSSKQTEGTRASLYQ